MASQEDYLDNLLKDMAGTGDEPENLYENSAENSEGGEPLDLDAVSGMTEAEIENLLSADNGDAEEDLFGTLDDSLSDEDVLKMLENSDDDDLKEIQDLLEKSDHNEEISGKDFDENDEILREKASVTGSETDQELPRGRQTAQGGKKEEEPQEKRESPEEKRERKKAEAAAKKAQKKASKEAAKQAKAGKRKKTTKKPVAEDAEAAGATEERADGKEDLMDMSLLDSILSEAKTSEKSPGRQEEQTEFFDIDAEAREVEEPAYSAFEREEEAGGEELQQEEAEKPEIDFGDLFQEEEGDSSGEKDDFSFPEETLELDLEEADQLIPERGGASDEGKANSEKKPLLSRIRDFLTEEDETENEDLRLSQENQDILNDLKKESGEEGKKPKKGGSAPKQKAKAKPKKAAKPKKPSKPRKAPEPKKQGEPKETAPAFGKKLSFKKILPVLLIGVSAGVLLFVFVNAAAEYTDRSNARAAFYQGDYETCYQNLKGKSLDETESIMFGKSESILYSRIWVREYEVYTGNGDTVRALESLIQAVNYYPVLQEKASRWNAQSEVAAGYAEILNLLESNYGLTESQAQEIASLRKDADYTRIITAIAGGQSFEKWSGPKAPGTQNAAEGSEGADEPTGAEAPAAGEDPSTADLLPEEEGIGDDTFIPGSNEVQGT